jgi:predicted double-glycine peptidase
MLLRYLNVNTSQTAIGNRYVDANKNLNFQKVANDANKKLTRLNIPGGQPGYQYIINKIKSLNKPFILQRKGITNPQKSHFVVVIGISSKGQVIVNDPRSTGGRNNILKASDLKDVGGSLRILN